MHQRIGRGRVPLCGLPKQIRLAISPVAKVDRNLFSMGMSFSITPSGNIRLLGSESESQVWAGAESLPEHSKSNIENLAGAFHESNAAGLVMLSSQAFDRELPADIAFWRSFAQRFFQAACHLGESGLSKWRSISPPAFEDLVHLTRTAPPMVGLEYLTVAVLENLWTQLREHVYRQAAAHRQGPAVYLRDVHPHWHLVGRVTFHLAENKKDPHRPFAFLATYTHKLSSQAKVQHLPLADALKTYAANRDLAKLESLLEPVRRAAEKSAVVRELLETKALFAAQAWPIPRAYAFLKETLLMEEAGVVVRVPDWWAAQRRPRPTVQVNLGTHSTSTLGFASLLNFDVGLAMNGEQLSPDEVKSLLDSTEGLVLLRGKWVEVDRAKLQEALDHWRNLQKERPDGISFIEGMRMLAGADLEGKAAAGPEQRAWSDVVSGPWLRETLNRMRNPVADQTCQPGRDLQATLRHYQVEGVRWLWYLTELRLGACLADDMGLGKTIQIIDLLLQRKHALGAGKVVSLLVVPASLLGNWRQELARFAPSLRVLFAHRSEREARKLARLAKNPQRELAGLDLVVTTYPLVRREEWFQEVTWSLAILDEAQAIKNASSGQTRSVKKLKATSRIVMTGTPVENHLGDLWSLFDFCCPGLLGSASQFKQFVKGLNERQDAEAFASLRRLVGPYILRRLKTDPTVVPDLPEKTEMRVECGLSKKQAVLYGKAIGDFEERLDQAEGIARRGLVLALLMQLKQLCNHPSQYLGDSEFNATDSGKFERLRMVCEPIAARQEKTLVFTQFQAMTEPLAHYLAEVFGAPGLVLHGGTPVRRRTELVTQFQNNEGFPFFVISLKAGGMRPSMNRRTKGRAVSQIRRRVTMLPTQQKMIWSPVKARPIQPDGKAAEVDSFQNDIIGPNGKKACLVNDQIVEFNVKVLQFGEQVLDARRDDFGLIRFFQGVADGVADCTQNGPEMNFLLSSRQMPATRSCHLAKVTLPLGLLEALDQVVPVCAAVSVPLGPPLFVYCMEAQREAK